MIKSHRDLLKLIDKKLLCEYYKVASLADKARIKSISLMEHIMVRCCTE